MKKKYRRALRGLDVPALAEELSAFIADELHYRPGGHLMTLHEVNVAFASRLREASIFADAVPPGLAAALLASREPALHEEMRCLAHHGKRCRGWRSGKRWSDLPGEKLQDTTPVAAAA